MMLFTKVLDILEVKKLVLRMLFLISMQEEKLICITLYLQKKILNLNNVIILIKSVFNKDQNYCYYKKFSEKRASDLPKYNDNKYVFT